MKTKNKYFSKRPVTIFFIISLAFAMLTVRIAVLMTSERSGYTSTASRNEVKFDTLRGYIYDRNMLPLVNDTVTNKAVLLTAETTKDMLPGLNNENKNGLKYGLLVSRDTDEKIPETDLSVNLQLKLRYSDSTLLKHIIGYLDSDGNGVCGLEKSFDAYLSNAGGTIGVSYSSSADGTALLGEKLTVENNGYDSAAGIVLTVDKNIQQIAEDCLGDSKIEKGACVILDTDTSEILAIVSVPSYDINDIAASLENDDLPFLNRALNAYPVGSVFKPFIALAAIEQGIDISGGFHCTGLYEVSGTVFSCLNKTAHGSEGINEAICNSCNCFFINAGIQSDAKACIELCGKLGFGKEIELTSCINSSSGYLPTENELRANSAMANFSFGQGELLATPLQLAAAYNVLASGGIYKEPSLMKYLVDENGNNIAFYEPEEEYRAVDEGVCNIINESLRQNMLEGTGINGNPGTVSCAGKTATAQTGEYDSDGCERLCTWFCGFFPFENPKYTVCIFDEDGTSASIDCAPVFRNLAEKITELK